MKQVDDAWIYADAAYEAFDDGDVDRANQLVDAALQTDPSNAKAHLLKGVILKRFAQRTGKPGDRGLLQQALAHAEEAARLDPNLSGAFYNIACYEALLGADPKVVVKNLARACEIDPKLRHLAAEDEDLRSVRDDPEFKGLTA